jgi:hypothetical protein
LLGVKQRFGAVGKKGSIALIERLWRTLKDTLGLRLLRPLVAEDLMEKIEIGLVHYAHFRPHQGLGGATPAEIYFGCRYSFEKQPEERSGRSAKRSGGSRSAFSARARRRNCCSVRANAPRNSHCTPTLHVKTRGRLVTHAQTRRRDPPDRRQKL